MKRRLPVLGLVAGLVGPAAAFADAPAQFKAKFVVPAGNSSSCALVTTVPADKRLVIEFVSSLARPLGLSGAATASQLKIVLDGVTVYHELDQRPVDATSNARVSQSLKLTAGAGTLVEFCAGRGNGVDTLNVNVSLAGTLADVP